MLTRLSIRDIVLIDRLDLDVTSGLSVLTGETGAGKSILLDAFALALGARGDVALVRQGADVNAHAKSGFTALMFAAQQGDAAAARTLLDAKANPNEVMPKSGATPLIIASDTADRA